NYRLMDQGLFVDLVGGVTLGLTDAEIANGSDEGKTEGNMNQGHHSIALGVAAGQKIDSWEWRAFLGLDYHLSGDAEMVNKGESNTKFDTDSYLNWKVSLDGQYRLDNKWAFAVGLDYILPGEQVLDIKEDGMKAEDKVQQDNHLRLRVAAKHNLSDSMLVTLGWDMTMSHDVETKWKEPGDNGKYTQEFDAAHRFVLGAQFLF